MTTWETRGYLTWPRSDGKPMPGTREEMGWSIGWNIAQQEENLRMQSQLSLDMSFDADYGHDSYAVQYRDQNNLEF